MKEGGGGGSSQSVSSVDSFLIQVTRLAADFDDLFLHRHDEDQQNLKEHRNHRSHNRHSEAKQKNHGRRIAAFV